MQEASFAVSRQGEKSRITIVDDHAIVRDGVISLINREPDMEVCCGASDARQAMKQLEHCQNLPDLAVVDLSLGEGVSGIELIKFIHTHYPAIRMLVMSMHDEQVYVERALKAGARGYIMKQEAFDRLLAAIRQVLRGEIYLSEQMRSRLLQQWVGQGAPQSGASPLSSLTDRELEVLRLVGMGFSTGEIAEQLHRSLKTIEANRSKARQKLGLKNNAELARFAVQWLAL